MISDIVYDKQLVNLVNDTIVVKGVMDNSGFLAFIAVLINSSLRLSIHSNRFIIKPCKWWVQQNHLSETICDAYKTGHARCWFFHYCIDWCVAYVETSFPDLGI
jgi:cell division transport system permease protein